MISLRRRGFWVAVAVAMLAFASGAGVAAARGAENAQSDRASVHQSVDRDAVVSVRPVVDRSSTGLDTNQSRLLVLAWINALLGAALLALAAGRAVELGTRRVGPTVSTRQRLDRGPPALAFA